MFLRRISPFRLVSCRRCFATSSPLSFQIRKVGVEVETLLNRKAKYAAIKQRQLAIDIESYGIKQLYSKQISAYKKQQNPSGEKREAIPVKLSHPLMVIDVANLMQYKHDNKYFSHPFAAKDLHADLRRAAMIGEARLKTINVEVVPEVSPKMEIVLVLEKLFRTGSYEGTIGNNEMWIRTIHAPDTRDVNENAGDDAVALATQRGREEGREVTLVSDDMQLGLRAAVMGVRLLYGRHFMQALKVDKAKQDNDVPTDRLWTRLRKIDQTEALTPEAARKILEEQGEQLKINKEISDPEVVVVNPVFSMDPARRASVLDVDTFRRQDRNTATDSDHAQPKIPGVSKFTTFHSKHHTDTVGTDDDDSQTVDEQAPRHFISTRPIEKRSKVRELSPSRSLKPAILSKTSSESPNHTAQIADPFNRKDGGKTRNPKKQARLDFILKKKQEKWLQKNQDAMKATD